MGILFGFAPWIVFWILTGNVPFLIAAVVALVFASVATALSRAAGSAVRALESGALATFVALTVLTLAFGDDFAAKWMLPLSIAGLALTTLAGALTGQPLMRESLAAKHPAAVHDTELFVQSTSKLTWMWLATFVAMSVSALIPPIADRDASILDAGSPLSYLGYWAIPFSLFGAAIVAAHVMPGRMLAGINDVERKTTFVAYSEATIDELYYLAQKHADTEVGAGQEAYSVRVGGAGTPLVGDESRQSWPSTYKVREKHR